MRDAKNPVQIIQGYVQRPEQVTLATSPPQSIFLQRSFPGATVTVRYPEDPQSRAKIFDEDGASAPNPFTLDISTAYYKFYAEPGRYDVEFSGTGISTPFKLEDVAIESLVYNVRDFGAKGDGITNDTQAIRDALAAMIASFSTTQGVGTLFFPNGKYKVSQQGVEPFILDLPSGIIVQGTAGPITGGNLSNCQIVLASPQTSIFRIGTDRSKIVIRDIGLTTTAGDNTGTIAIEAREEIAGLSTYDVEFNNVTIWGFERGISIEGSHLSDQWDITSVRVNHCAITDSRYCIYLNSQNCDFMKISDTRVGVIPAGFGIYMEKVGIITIDGVLGAGTMIAGQPSSDTFIYITAAHGTVNITGCECEGFARSIKIVPLSVGNLGWPIVVFNCTWGNEILLQSECDYVSIGNHYLVDSVQCDPNVTARIFSFGDVFVDADKNTFATYDFNLNGSSTRLVSRANPFRVDFQRPARFGGQVGMIAGWLENIPLAVSPFEEGGEQLSLCEVGGNPVFKLRADGNSLFFDGVSSGIPLMKLDRGGNLYVRGDVFPNTDPSL